MMGLGGAGGSRTLAWGFAMAPHRLRILVFFTSNQQSFSYIGMGLNGLNQY